MYPTNKTENMTEVNSGISCTNTIQTNLFLCRKATDYDPDLQVPEGGSASSSSWGWDVTLLGADCFSPLLLVLKWFLDHYFLILSKLACEIYVAERQSNQQLRSNKIH